MAYEQLKSAALPRVVGDVVSDLLHLVQAEVRLAKAEITSKLAVKAQSAIWFAAAGVMGLVTLFLLAQAAVFFLVAAGFASQWASLIVAGAFCVLALTCMGIGKSAASEEVVPERTAHQITKDIQLVKEHLT